MLCYAMLCYAILYHTILYYNILYYTILYFTILYYTKTLRASWDRQTVATAAVATNSFNPIFTYHIQGN